MKMPTEHNKDISVNVGISKDISNEERIKLFRPSPPQFYNPAKLLNEKDLDGVTPGVFMVVSNRSAGKTTGFLKKFIEDWWKTGRQFALILRKQKLQMGITEKFTDCLNIYPELGTNMTMKSVGGGLFYQLFIDGKHCGNTVSLHDTNSLKDYSAAFSKVDTLFMDEFIKEKGGYVENEMQEINNVIISLQRGGGFQARPITLIMCANEVTNMNPAFIHFGIYNRIRPNTKMLHGKRWVLQHHFNKTAQQAIDSQPINIAFRAADSKIHDYSTGRSYLIDDSYFIENMKGRNKYLATIKTAKGDLGLRIYHDKCILYISSKPEPSWKGAVITFDYSQHTTLTEKLGKNHFVYKTLIDYFNRKLVRFDNLKTKQIALDILAVNMF